MPLVMIRIDDRLIHGQVVVGWGSVLKPDRILLSSDEVATVEWQRTIYLSAVPEYLKASVLTLEDSVETLTSNKFGDEKILLLVDSPKSVVYLVENGVDMKEVNVGGMHFKPGKNQISPFIFVDQNDIVNFKILCDKGIKLEGRDVPTRSPVDICRILGFK
ncbi:PTS mannose/fructose/sorbose transporter subunit IIB [candidate division KSB1 bacterium]|nr:PTS sugar transporter subunit IIB [candidate division KSB1 bacterium]RQW02697.1 MAG: PTS mannose/fructose/sorbose transporter subunit IIB [candidate division KSB1 bacterium]